MNFHRQRTNRKYIIILFAVLGLIFAGIVVRPAMPFWITEAVHTLGYPFWAVRDVFLEQTVTFQALIRSKESLMRDNEALQKELENVRLKELSQELLREENRSLKDLLGRTSYEDTLLAAILARPNVTPYDTFIIDVGETHDVSVGDVVLVPGDIIIGTVSKVFANDSTVTLFSSPGVETNVFIGSENILGTAVGQGGGNFIVSLPRDIAVAVGDSVIIPDIATRLFAVVEKVIANPSDSFQTIRFKMPINFLEVRFVHVVRKEHGFLNEE